MLQLLRSQAIFTVSIVTASIIISSSSLAFSAEYYTVRDAKNVQDANLDPFSTLTTLEESIEITAEAVLSLMDWQGYTKKLETPQVPYNRLAQYGTWVTDPDDGTCYNTRARVLIRQSEVPVTFNAKGCTVLSGKWLDPYSHAYFSTARDLDIDHVVPLKNSYVSGAWKWDNNKRCLYANFMKNNFHLLAVQGDENKQKGDSSPEKFMPVDPKYKCEYLASWLKIKLIWNLALTSSEGAAIEQLAQDNRCNTDELSIKVKDLQTQRKAIADNMGFCER